MRRLWQTHRRLVIAFGVTAGLAVILLVRGLVLVPPRGDPDMPVAAWMTPGFVVHTYHLDPDVMSQILGEAPGERRRQTLAQIATAQGRVVTEILAELQAAIDDARAQHGDRPQDPNAADKSP